MSESQWTAPEFDTEVATPARMYDYYLGGKDNFAADRAAAEKVLQNMPKVRAFARANRAFLGRAVRAMAAEGVSQFLDIGIGLPGPGGTVESALAARPDAHIVGVDNDPIVLAHARARPVDAGVGAVTIVPGDLRDPAAILADPQIRDVLDFDRPIGVMLIAVLHFVSDGEGAHDIVKTLMNAVPAGSFLALTHLTCDFDEELVAASAKAYDKATARVTARSLKETTAFYDGLEVLDPGVVLLPRWRPDGPVQDDADDIWMYGALGRKG